MAVRGKLVPRFFWGTYVKRTFISAVAVLAFAATAHADELTDIQAQAKQLREQNQAMTKRLAALEQRQKALETKPAALSANPVDAMAADLPYKAAVKARPPENDDMCWHGICLYGNFDMGVTYEQHGTPFNALAGGPLNYAVEKASNGNYFGVGANIMSTSFIGLRGKQEVADNLYAVFNLQTLFNPATGANVNQIGGIAQNNGLGANVNTLQWANSYGDSSKSGVMFNNVAYFGISSPTYGTFTMGRQSALTSDLVVNYDALSGANAFSMITFEGATGGGGDTEDRIYDNSYEYRLNVGPVRLAGIAQLRNGGNSATGNAFEGDIGFDYMGFSMDFVAGKIYDANGIATTLSTTQMQQINASGFGCSYGCVASVVSDNTIFAVAAKYTIGPWKLYGGYEHIQYTNPDNPLVGIANGAVAFMNGGYNIAFANNNFFGTRQGPAVVLGWREVCGYAEPRCHGLLLRLSAEQLRELACRQPVRQLHHLHLSRLQRLDGCGFGGHGLALCPALRLLRRRDVFAEAGRSRQRLRSHRYQPQRTRYGQHLQQGLELRSVRWSALPVLIRTG